MMTETITIRAALSKAERDAAVAYIEDSMRKSFGCEPPPTRGFILTAHADDTIVGSAVMQGAKGDHPLSLEGRYVFEDEQSPIAPLRARIVEGMRWTAHRPSVSKDIVLALMYVAYELGKTHMLIEAKPYAIKRLAELDIEFLPLPSARILLDSVRAVVGEGGMAFYETPPIPQLYLAHIPTVLVRNNHVSL